MATEKRLIDANELLEKHTCDVYGAYDDSCMVQAVFVPYIKGAPTVDAVEVVHGHWIKRQAVNGQVYCSECATIEKVTDGNYKSRHCPNCGAKMDGDGND